LLLWDEFMAELSLSATRIRRTKLGASKRSRWIAFCFGLAALGIVLHYAWAGTFDYMKYILSASVQARFHTSYRFGCLGPQCDRCLAQIDEHPNGIVITGASGAAYAIDLELLKKASSRPLINCMINGVEFDEYNLILNVANKLKPQQTLLHAINSWVAVAPTPLRSIVFESTRRPESSRASEPISRPIADAWELAKVASAYFLRHHRELQVRWRSQLHAANPEFAESVYVFPFNLAGHLEAKEDLMRRWIGVSPWTAQYIPRARDVPTYDAVRDRLVALRSHFEPVKHRIFMRLPEYTSITNAGREDLFRHSNEVFKRVVADLGDVYLDVDYKECGLNNPDFWKGYGEGGSYGIDPTHLNHTAKAKITACMAKGLQAYDLFR
jgi:hypothetical protein